MTRKTLLVLAASRYQIPIITTAKRLGYRVLTIDNVPDNPGHALADQACFIDTTDIQGVLAVARRERVDGVIAACTDVAGSSLWFERGLVCYSNAAKTELLGVPAALIERHGAVSDAVVNISATQKIEERRGAQGFPQMGPGTPFDDLFEEFFKRRGR